MTVRTHPAARRRPSSILAVAGAALTLSLAACSGAEVLDRRAAAAADPVVIVQRATSGATAPAATSTATRTRADGSMARARSGVVVG